MKYICIKDRIGTQTALRIENIEYRRGYMRLENGFPASAVCIIPLTQEGKTESEVKDIAAELTLRRGHHNTVHVDTDKKVVYATDLSVGPGLEVQWFVPSEVYKMETGPVAIRDAFISLLEDPTDRSCMYKLSQVM